MNDEQRQRHAVDALLAEAARVAETDRAFAELLRDADRWPVQPLTSTPRRTRRPWLAVAGLAVIVIASIVVVVRRGDGPTRIVNDTPPAIGSAVTPTPITTSPITTTPETSSPGTSSPATTVQASAPTSAGSIDVTVAGSSGVWSYGLGGASKWTNDEMSFAIRLPDGRILAQRKSGWGDWPAADTTPLVIDLSDQEATVKELSPGRDWHGWVRLHDVNVVDGDTLLLYEIAQVPDPGASRNTVIAEDLDTGDVHSLAAAGAGWEHDTSRLHLSAIGWVVGDSIGLGSRGPQFLSIGGAPPLLPSIGLQSDYDSECTDCPRSVTVSHDGALLAWLEGTDVVVVRADDASQLARVPLGDAADTANLELDIDGDRALIGRRWPAAVDSVGPLLVTIGATPTITELTGTVATFAPATRSAPVFDELVGERSSDTAGCGATSPPRQLGPVGVFIHTNAAPHPVQLIATASLGIYGPYAIVERLFTDQRTTAHQVDADVPIGQQIEPARIAPDGQSDVVVLLSDGSEVYIRARGLDSAQMVALASGLVARPADAAIAGFDFVPPARSGLTLVDETAALTGAAATASCTFDDGRSAAAGVLGGDPVFQYAVAMDWSPAPTVIDLGDGRILAVRAQREDINRVLASISNAR